MKLKYITLAFSFFLLIIFIFNNQYLITAKNQNDTMIVEANILEQVASVDVSDYFFFGNITKGYKSDNIKVNVNNTGTTDIKITPLLANSSEIIFSYLYFQRRTTDSYKKIGNFSMNISKPGSIGGKQDDYFYMKLDLTNFPDSIEKDEISHKANITIWAMPN